MSALRSVIEEITTTDLNRFSDGDLTEEAIEVSRAIDVLTHRLAEIAENARSRGCFRQAGYLNVTRWLADVTDLDDATARGLVALGGTLSAHSDTRRLSSQGDLSRARLRVLSRAGKAHPTHFDRDEEMLLDFASTLTMSDFKKAVAYWSNCADAERAEIEAAEQCDSARLHASKTFGGMVALDGSFDPEGGEIILQALDAAMTPEARRDGASGDLRPAPRRRADALVQICRQYLASYPGVVGGHRPHATLIVDLDTLMGRSGKRCELSQVGTITPETARRILCDAEVSRLIVAGDSVPLEMGRAVRTATPAQRRALAVRDGGCARKGCDRRPEWCDVHHKTHWIHGGETNLADLELLCRPHHIEEHEKNPSGPGPPCRH
jgi:hypothetical protein